MNLKPRIFFAGPQVVRTRSAWRGLIGGSTLIVTAQVLAVAAAFVMGAWLDHDDLHDPTALQRAFESGRQQGHAELIASAEAAWQAANAEAELCRQRMAGRPVRTADASVGARP